jgi:hypothetical protein
MSLYETGEMTMLKTYYRYAHRVSTCADSIVVRDAKTHENLGTYHFAWGDDRTRNLVNNEITSDMHAEGYVEVFELAECDCI